MNWRNPKEMLPGIGQVVWVMLEPHKDRGSLLSSSPSIEIVCGWVRFSNNGKHCIVENNDELGLGSIDWELTDVYENEDNYSYPNTQAIAWLPIEEMPLPRFIK